MTVDEFFEQKSNAFNLMVIANDAYQQEKAAGRASNGFSEIWLPFLDSLRNELAAYPEDILANLSEMENTI